MPETNDVWGGVNESEVIVDHTSSCFNAALLITKFQSVSCSYKLKVGPDLVLDS